MTVSFSYLESTRPQYLTSQRRRTPPNRCNPLGLQGLNDKKQLPCFADYRRSTHWTESLSECQMTSGGEMAGVELVCRLMAATPPYLYNPSGPPHCFFFSDLLRSLVAKRCASSPPEEDSVSAKRLRLTSTGSAFTAKTAGSLEEGRFQNDPDLRRANPLSPSSFLPRLNLLYRKLSEKEREASSTTSDKTHEAPPYEVDCVKNEGEAPKLQ